MITEEHSRKKEYYITDSGKVAVENEIKRLEELLKNGKTITGRCLNMCRITKWRFFCEA